MSIDIDSGWPTYYVTTAIAYANGEPHIGHAYEYIATDAVARFKRLDGHRVLYLTGTDEHGLKVTQAAAREGIPTRDLARRNSDVFERLQHSLQISFDRFIRTTDPDHHRTCQALWQKMVDNGDIYKDTYAGWYSVRDEALYAGSDTTLNADGVRVATDSGTPVEWTEEPSYFFRLSNYQDRLLAYYENHPEFLDPHTRRNEIISLVKCGLNDLSISRTSFDWGIPVPDDPAHVMYVWVDALANYLTGVDYPNTDGALYRDFWPADLQMIGKDITRFHAVHWPAFLMSAGIELPRRIFAHGFLYNNGQKMSKSVGNVVDPFMLIKEYGLDAVRFFLLRQVPFGQDGNYSHDAIVTRINADLANELGNLAQRSLTMVAKNCDARVPTPSEFTDEDRRLLNHADSLLDSCREHIERQDLHLSLEAIWSLLAETNRYFSAQQPWVLRKTNPARMDTVLFTTLDILRTVGTLIQPVMPESAARLLDLLAVENRNFDGLAQRLIPGVALPTPYGVFPRYPL